MESIQFNPSELPAITVLVLVGGIVLWRFLGLLEGGLRFGGQALRDFTEAVRRGSEIDSKQTDLIERLDQRLMHQLEALQQWRTIIEGWQGSQTEGFSDVLERFDPVTASLTALEMSVNELPEAVKVALQPIVQAAVAEIVAELAKQPQDLAH